jgi:hypothetical protein
MVPEGRSLPVCLERNRQKELELGVYCQIQKRTRCLLQEPQEQPYGCPESLKSASKLGHAQACQCQ